MKTHRSTVHLHHNPQYLCNGFAHRTSSFPSPIHPPIQISPRNQTSASLPITDFPPPFPRYPNHSKRAAAITIGFIGAEFPGQDHARRHRLPRMDRRQMGDLVLAPGGFHARVHDGTGGLCETEARIRSAGCEIDRTGANLPLLVTSRRKKIPLKICII